MHASKVPHKRDKKPSRACPNNCGFTIADRDPHRECTICLGYGHAQEAVEAGNCKDCQCLSASKLRSRLAFMEQLEHQDDDETANKLLEPMTRGDEADLPLSSEQMDESGPSPVVTDDPDAMSQAAPEPEVEEEPLSGTEATLHQACKRAAEKLGLSWPALPPPAKRSRLDGCFLPKATPTRQQRLPVFPDVMEDLTMSWKTPYYTKSPFASFTMLDMDGMEELGWDHMPPVEPSLANHLAPPSGNRTANAAPKMPNKDNRYISLLWEKTYKTAALTGRALNASSLLMAYLADLQEEMSTALQEGRPTEETWTEIRTVTDLVLRISRCSAQSIGRIMGLAVVGNRNLWLNLSSASDKDKIVVLNHPLSPDGLFGSATTAVLEKFEPRQQAALKPNRSVGPQQRIHQKQQQQQQQRPRQLHQQRPHQQQYPHQQQLHPRHQKQHPRHQQHPRQQHCEGTPTYTHQARAATSTDQWPAVDQRSGSWDRTHEEDTEFHRPLASIEDRMRYAVLSKLHQTSYDY
ncbi:uncharacterized protein LOC134452882 [Engraulis encrasicolus]|uniref:uncharacterized protein LOC134452882 n=1 Tax=Engraulis encrasicolus TaxID=184585 RepID=UPI002FD70AE9